MNIKQMLALSEKLLENINKEAKKKGETPQMLAQTMDKQLVCEVEKLMPKKQQGTYEEELTLAVAQIIGFMAKNNLTTETLSLAGNSSYELLETAIKNL